MTFKLEAWDNQHASACEMLDTLDAAFPMGPRIERKHAVKFFQDTQKGFEKSCLIAKCDDKIVGVAMLSMAGSHEVIRVLGAVHPSYWHMGIGKALLKRMTENARTHADKKGLEASAFLSCKRAVSFLEAAGFKENDRLHWLERPVQEPFADWAISKTHAISKRNIRVILGTEFEDLRPDWDRAWWALKMECDQDIPSTTPFEALSFDDWRFSL